MYYYIDGIRVSYAKFKTHITKKKKNQFNTTDIFAIKSSLLVFIYLSMTQRVELQWNIDDGTRESNVTS